MIEVDFLGLHFYFGSQRLTIDPIIQTIEVVEQSLEIFQQAHIRLNVVDLGLGCGVPYLAKDSTLDVHALRKHMQPKWRHHPWHGIEIWSEVGRALVARSGCFVARVTERKHLHNETFVFLDGGLNVHNPGVGLGRFFQINPSFHFITQSLSDHVETVHVVGNLCTSADCLGRNVVAPKLDEGDLVVIPNAGAYCLMTGLWGFNSQRLCSEAMLMRDGSLKMLTPQYQLLSAGG